MSKGIVGTISNQLINAATDKTFQALRTGKQKESIAFMDPSLYRAAAEGHTKPFKHLDLVLLVTPNKNTVLHINITAESESIEFVEKMVKRCPPLLLQVNIKDETPLHIAARHGNVGVVSLLIETAKAHRHHNKDLESGIGSVRKMLQMVNKERDTALHEAVRNNHLGVVKLLINEDPHFSYPANDAGETPLYLAAERGYRDLVFEILAKSTSPEHGGPIGRTALHAAVICRDEEMIREIIVRDTQRNLTKEADYQGWTPLHYAALFGHVSIVKQLLEFDKSAAYIADINEKKTALHIAAGQGHKDVRKELLSSCPDCCELVDNNLISHNEEEEMRKQVEKTIKKLTKTKDAHLFVSILISTVTFAAAMTMPGGFISDDHHEQGSATLGRTTSFQAFVIANTLALACSSSAVSIHLFMALHKDMKYVGVQFTYMYMFTIYSMLQMMIAFVAGTYAVLEHSRGLAIANSLVGCVFFLLFLVFFYFNIYFLRKHTDNPKPLIKYLIWGQFCEMVSDYWKTRQKSQN